MFSRALHNGIAERLERKVADGAAVQSGVDRNDLLCAVVAAMWRAARIVIFRSRITSGQTICVAITAAIPNQCPMSARRWYGSIFAISAQVRSGVEG